MNASHLNLTFKFQNKLRQSIVKLNLNLITNYKTPLQSTQRLINHATINRSRLNNDKRTAGSSTEVNQEFRTSKGKDRNAPLLCGPMMATTA